MLGRDGLVVLLYFARREQVHVPVQGERGGNLWREQCARRLRINGRQARSGSYECRTRDVWSVEV